MNNKEEWLTAEQKKDMKTSFNANNVIEIRRQLLTSVLCEILSYNVKIQPYFSI